MARTKQTARMCAIPIISQGVAPDLDFDPYDEGIEEDWELEEYEQDTNADSDSEKIQAGALIELKDLDKRYNDRGQLETAETASRPEAKGPSWYEKWCLCQFHEFDRSNSNVVRRTLQVNSPYLKAVLKKVIGTYPGISFDTKHISLQLPADCLFHYRGQLKQVATTIDADSNEAKQLKILNDFIDDEFADTIKESRDLREQGLVTFAYLWTLFCPGTTVYSVSAGQHRAFKLVSYAYQCGAAGPFLSLQCAFVCYDGNNFGTVQCQLNINGFAGSRSIASLNVFPLRHHQDNASIEKYLIARGRRFEALAGRHIMEYVGVAHKSGSICGKRHSVSGRVMIDCATVARIDPGLSYNVTPLKGQQEIAFDKANTSSASPDAFETASENLTDRQCLLAHSMVRGFSFTEKRFLDFFVDLLTEPVWNETCFDQLVLPEETKETVQALVSTHAKETIDFDDIVKNKGRGLIFVLHGPPGVGKTLTAECVAEYTKRPLYMVSSGELDTDADALDTRLSQILDIASTWNAVLLIDEADVFLEKRASHDLVRNSIVSIFLRTLEYYSGVLFLTTNRVQQFDDAFKSRIHVPLKYDVLPVASRRQIWKNFLQKGENEGTSVGEDDFARLAEADLNGRQIKNIIRTAKSLAAHKKTNLTAEQLMQVMKIQVQFEKDLA